jgi:hypothetical protein
MHKMYHYPNGRRQQITLAATASGKEHYQGQNERKTNREEREDECNEVQVRAHSTQGKGYTSRPCETEEEAKEIRSNPSRRNTGVTEENRSAYMGNLLVAQVAQVQDPHTPTRYENPEKERKVRHRHVTHKGIAALLSPN